MKSIISILGAFTFALAFASFQDTVDVKSKIEISGIVVDPDSKPLEKVIIYNDTKNILLRTDALGAFTINLDSLNSKIRFELKGYEAKEHLVISTESISIILYEVGIEKLESFESESADFDGVSRKEMAILSESKTIKAMHSESSSGTKLYDASSGVKELAPSKIMMDRSGIAGKKKYTAESGSPSFDFGGEMKLELNSGILTAGEWNDLNNWTDWNALVSEKSFIGMQAYWDIYPDKRYSFFVTNKYELPLVNAQVLLLNEKSEVVWEAITDNAGKAELWASIFKNGLSEGEYKCEIRYNGIKEHVKDLKSFEDGYNHVMLDVECEEPRDLDIMFVVDATGSMSDEIQYLKTELQDVIDRSKKLNRDLNLRLGSVFYRDRNDEYVSRVTPLSASLEDCYKFIGMQSAAGGGDYPEAIEEGLDKALAQPWSDNAIAKLIFLVLDAPAHNNNLVKRRLQSQIEEAASLGIKIIPVTASGINRQTEFLMKFMSISTNGTYVFLTDDSGIGNPHLTPLVDDFEVEKLNDLLVRLIHNFSASNGCQSNQQSEPFSLKLYPNPSSDFVHIELNQAVDALMLRSSSGKLLKSMEKLDEGTVKLDLSDFIDGMYSVQVLVGGELKSKSLIIINS